MIFAVRKQSKIQQLELYIDFLRNENEKITDKEKQKTFFGYLIGSNYSEETKGLRDRVHSDGIYTQTWDTLLDAALKSHKEFFNVMQNKVPPGDPRLEHFQ